MGDARRTGARRRSSRLRLMVLAAVATVSLVACGSSGSTADSDTAQPSSGDASAPGLLQFTAPLVGGGEFNGASYAGRPVMFWFWAPT